MNQFARVFFQVNALDSDRVGFSVIAGDLQETVLAKGSFVLRNLVALGKIRIKVVLAGKARVPVDHAPERQPSFDRELHGLLVKHRKGAGLAGAHRADAAVGRNLVIHGTGAEELGLRLQLYVCFKTDDDVKIHERIQGGVMEYW
jgi:hypothetical protein